MLFQQFQKHIISKNLFSKHSKLLLAVSGGKDSMALARLIEISGHAYSVAHCNFCLRKEESDRDEKFVSNYFNDKNVKVYTKRFDTLSYSEAKNMSVQMAARELRYAWFYELASEHGFDCIVTAHHLNDSIETFYINTLRGTGLNGLKGIPEKQDKIVRPLLPFNSEEIERFISENSIPFVEDSSNREPYYLRNKLRHNVFPQLKEINPQLEQTFKKQLFVFNQTAGYIEGKLEEDFSKITTIDKDKIRIKCSDISNFKFSELIIHYILKKFGFSSELTDQLNLMIQHPQSGKKITGKSYTCLIDRGYFVFKKNSTASSEEQIQIHERDLEMKYPISLKFVRHEDFFIDEKKTNACLDAEKINFPLVLRKWRKGDYYFPIGMKGKKKLSDFFTNYKYSSFEKEDQWLLTSNDEIIWIVGKRVDRRFMVTDQTKITIQVILNE